MQGLLESLLTKLYGKPNLVQSMPFAEYRWHEIDPTNSSVLYKPPKGDVPSCVSPLIPVYGDFSGGFIAGDSIKVSMLQGPKVWGLYQIDDLQNHPHVVHALNRDPRICYFMDAANVWFYGIKDGELYVYDSDPDELNRLGPIELALGRLIREWEKAKPKS